MGNVKSDTHVWDEVRARVKDIGKKRVRVGVIGNGKIAGIAAAHEFGSEDGEHPPERSFIRFTFEKREKDMEQVCERLARSLLAGSTTVDKALGFLGAWSVAAIKRSITTRAIRQELADSTLERKARKGNKNPTALVETGQLLGAITWAIGRNE